MSSVTQSLDDLKTALQSIAELGNRVDTVFTPEELVKVIKGVSLATVGIVYEGMQAIPEEGSTNRGLGSTASFGLYLAVDATPVANTSSQRAQAIVLLSLMRQCLAERKAPGGHYWRFSSEGYSGSFPNKALWVQKWSTRLMVPT